jgi:hypothetical protein
MNLDSLVVPPPFYEVPPVTIVALAVHCYGMVLHGNTVCLDAIQH